MTVNKKMILDRIKANLKILKHVNQKRTTYKDKLDKIEGFLRLNPQKTTIENDLKKQKHYASIFLAILHEDLFFLMDCNSISIPQYQKCTNMLVSDGLNNKETSFYKMLKVMLHFE